MQKLSAKPCVLFNMFMLFWVYFLYSKSELLYIFTIELPDAVMSGSRRRKSNKVAVVAIQGLFVVKFRSAFGLGSFIL